MLFLHCKCVARPFSLKTGMFFWNAGWATWIWIMNVSERNQWKRLPKTQRNAFMPIFGPKPMTFGTFQETFWTNVLFFDGKRDTICKKMIIEVKRNNPFIWTGLLAPCWTFLPPWKKNNLKQQNHVVFLVGKPVTMPKGRCFLWRFSPHFFGGCKPHQRSPDLHHCRWVVLKLLASLHQGRSPLKVEISRFQWAPCGMRRCGWLVGDGDGWMDGMGSYEWLEIGFWRWFFFGWFGVWGGMQWNWSERGIPSLGVLSMAPIQKNINSPAYQNLNAQPFLE